MDNITVCFNPENVVIFKWGVLSSAVIVFGISGLLLSILVANHYRKKWKSSAYDITTTPSPYEEIEIGSVEDEDSSNTDTFSIHDKTE